MLFPEELTMPPSCGIKGKLAVRARVTGNIGIYHLQGLPELSRDHQAGPLVLLGGRRPGRGLPQGLQLPPAEMSKPVTHM